MNAYFKRKTTFLFIVAVFLLSNLALAETPLPDLLVSSFETDEIIRYSGSNGGYIEDFVTQGSGGLNGPTGFVYGPDGNLYVSSTLSSSILCYDGETGVFIKTFVSSNSGGLLYPRGLAFGPNGHLYVASEETDSVLKYNGQTGAFIGTFVNRSSGGLDEPRDLVFGPDNHLYVCSLNTNSILKYDGSTGVFLKAFVPSASGGLSAPRKIVFHTDGKMYVSSYWNRKILRYNAATGAFIDCFILGSSSVMNGPIGFTIAEDGDFFIASEFTDSVLRYSGSTGQYKETFVNNSSGGLDLPVYVVFYGSSSTKPTPTPPPTEIPTETPTPTPTATPTPEPVGWLAIDLDREAEGIQETGDFNLGQTLSGRLVVGGLPAYRGYAARVQIDPPEAAGDFTQITFFPGDLPDSGVAHPAGLAQATAVYGISFIQDMVLQLLPPYTDISELPSTVFGFNIPLSMEYEGEARIHIIYDNDPDVPDPVSGSLSIISPDPENSGLSLGYEINQKNFVMTDAVFTIERKPLNVELAASISPNEPKTLDDLQCDIDLNNVGGYDNLVVSYRWFKNGTELSEPLVVEGETLSVTGATLSHLYTQKGDVFACEVTVTDGISEVEVTTDSVTILNSPPTAPMVQILPPNPGPGTDLGIDIITYSTDADGDTVRYHIRWYESTDQGETWVHKVEHDDQPSVSGIYIQENDQWRVEYEPYEVVSGASTQLRGALQEITGEAAWDEVWVGENKLPSITLIQPATGGTYALPGVEIGWLASDPEGDPVSVDLFYSKQTSPTDLEPIASNLPANGTYSWTPPDSVTGIDNSGDGIVDSADLFLFSHNWQQSITAQEFYIFARAWDSKAKAFSDDAGLVVVPTEYPGDVEGLLEIIRNWKNPSPANK